MDPEQNENCVFCRIVARQSPADITYEDDAVLAFGSERHGLSAGVRARADLVVSLPMRPKVSSYNLTTSVAMGLYHWELFRRAS